MTSATGGGVDRAVGSAPRPSGTPWRVLVTVCWLIIAVATFVDPFLLLIWPVTGPAFLVAIIGGLAELRTAFASKERLPQTRSFLRLSRAALVLLAGCSLAGAITSVVPSMAYRPEEGDIFHEYCLSSLVAPALWGAIFGTSIGAIMIPSPRRLALASVAGIVSWPLFLVIRVHREPLFDWDNQFLLLAPWIVQLYVVAASVASGLAITLAFVARHATAEPSMKLPPKASVVSER